MNALERLYLNREVAELQAKPNRLDAEGEKNAVFTQLMELEVQVYALSPEYWSPGFARHLSSLRLVPHEPTSKRH